MRFITVLAVLTMTAASYGQTLPVTYADLTASKQAELVEAWKKNYRSEISALPPGQAPVAMPSVAAIAAKPPAVAIYHARWTHPADLRAHLLSELHGFDAAHLAGMTTAELERLHDEDHDRRAATARSSASSSMVSSSSITRWSTSSTNCPGGVCPSPAISSTTSTAAVSQPLILPGFQPFGGRFRPLK